ncbi:hypothetical protein [cf. Phormidesmis sp. LEGE 11477]|uniref:hypothetical protein n=1 Tax=cf. Phormidesmis sp. LEGE 11477 TaxID=1828680 RepID=UPI00187E1C1B|nr:hypothetical protein [cf. Phormidesmis sp. LEGE 11477]MBE9062012.1 hypothetical protein [cf. Phormidesmis sp. LEGE 11477]
MIGQIIDRDAALFIFWVLLLVGYLVFSAKTEMGTQIKWPWKKVDSPEKKQAK